MARYIKQFDPEETHRRIAVDIQEAHCPGLLEFLSTLPFGYEGPGLRAIAYQWFLAREADGTLHDAFEAVVSGPGGLSGTRISKKKVQTTKRASTRPAVQAVRPKRAAQTAPAEEAPDVSPQVQSTVVQKLSLPTIAALTVQSQAESQQPGLLHEPKEIAGAPSLLAVPVPSEPEAAAKDGEVELEEITQPVYEALMNLDTMFN